MITLMAYPIGQVATLHTLHALKHGTSMIAVRAAVSHLH